MTKKKQKITIFKSYERKVNLMAISSQYDNISLGSHAVMEVEISDEKDLKKEMEKLNKIVVDETEKDVVKAFTMLFKMAEDRKNQAIIATGKTMELEGDSDTEESKKPTQRKKAAKKSAKVTEKKEVVATLPDDFFGNGEMTISGEDLESTPVVGDLMSGEQLSLDEVDISDFDTSDFDSSE